MYSGFKEVTNNLKHVIPSRIDSSSTYIFSLLRDILSSIKCLVREINYGVRISEHKECVRKMVCPEMATEEGKITNAR